MPPMQKDFLSALLDSPARARLLRAFVFDPDREFSIQDIAKRTALSAVSATREMKWLEKNAIVKRLKQISIELKNAGGKKISRPRRVDAWKFNAEYPQAQPLARFVHEISPMKHEIVLKELRRCGKISVVVLSGSFMGDPSRPADVIVAGEDINVARLDAATKRLETELGREIRYAHFTPAELRYRMTVQDRLIRDTFDYPHTILLDKARLF